MLEVDPSVSHKPATALAVALLVALALAFPADAHRSGCHRWHSCPSDTGSYVCGDLGYSRFCPKKPAATRKPTSRQLRSGGLKPGDVFSGRASVYDGDGPMLFVGQRLVEIRLSGIDAPEMRQPCKYDGKLWACGADAAAALRRLVSGKHLVCRVEVIGRYGRPVSLCTVGGLSINVEMVRIGFAVAYRKYPTTDRAVWSAIMAAQREAKAGKRGIWSGQFDMPWDWRKRRRK